MILFDAEAFSDAIKKAREDNGLLAIDISSKLGISLSTYSVIEHGKIIPTPRIISEICAVLEIDKPKLFKKVDVYCEREPSNA